MSDRICAHEDERVLAENSPAVAGKSDNGPAACPMQGKERFKRALGIAICCGAPLLLLAAISFFSLSLGAIASGALGLAALLACPVGMYFMMRMMMKEKKQDQPSRK